MFDTVLRALSCLNPCCHIGKYQIVRCPEDYATYKVSCWANQIKEVVERVLIAENQQNSKYQRVIQEMLDKLPEDEGWSRTIPTLVACRFRVLWSKEKAMDGLPKTKRSIWAAGTDCDEGQFCIFVPSDIGAIVTMDALPYLVSREVYHILEKMRCAKAVTSCAAIVLSRRAESQADAFASHHCTQGEKEYALGFERDYWYAKQRWMG